MTKKTRREEHKSIKTMHQRNNILLVDIGCQVGLPIESANNQMSPGEYMDSVPYDLKQLYLTSRRTTQISNYLYSVLVFVRVSGRVSETQILASKIEG